MTRYIAFLRGMNLGRRRIKNPELCACFGHLGFDKVSAFLASGNVMFDSNAPAETLRDTIETGLQGALDYAVPTFIRTASAVQAIASHAPYTPEQCHAGKLQVALLHEAPSPEQIAQVAALATDRDRLRVHGRELYWLPEGGVSQTKLKWTHVEAIVGGTTVRTKRTFERLAAKY